MSKGAFFGKRKFTRTLVDEASFYSSADLAVLFYELGKNNVNITTVYGLKKNEWEIFK